MTLSIGIVLGLLVVTIVLFAIEKLSVDVVTLIMLVALVLSGILTPEEAFAGFANEIIVILASIFVISGALERSGLMDALGAWIAALASGSRSRLLFLVVSVVSAVSGFMNNTTATAIFVPPVLGAARRTGVSASKLLMPLAYASILGGTCTLIGTSTNIAVSGFIARSGMEPLSLFEVTPVGLAIVAVGIAYLMLIGHRLLPEHKTEGLAESFEITDYLSEIIICPESTLVGQRIFESDLARKGFRILKVLREHDGEEETLMPGPRTTFQAHDTVLVEGKLDELLAVKKTAGIEIHPELKLGDLDLQSDEIKVVQMLVTPQSDLIGRTLKEANFRERYGITVLAIYRHGHSERERLARIRLKMGDLLLVQGPADRLAYLRRHPDLWTLEEMSPTLYRGKKGFVTLGLFGLAIVAGALEVAPLSVALLAAAVLAVVFRGITVDEAYEFIDWRLIILIGGMTAFGVAMEKTGAAEVLARGVVWAFGGGGELVVLGNFFVLTMLLTQPMSNAAAALVVLPVALQAARALGANERTFAIAIMLAASVSFVTPFEPACILVYGPGKYRFKDFVKVGALLTAILLPVVLVLVPLFWPLHPAVGHGAK